MYPWSLTVNLEVLKLEHLLRFWLAAKVLCLERMGYINTATLFNTALLSVFLQLKQEENDSQTRSFHSVFFE